MIKLTIIQLLLIKGIIPIYAFIVSRDIKITPYYHGVSSRCSSTKSLHLNRILFEWDEITRYSKIDKKSTTPIAIVKLDIDDYRCKHICNILKLEDGDTVRAGIVNEYKGEIKDDEESDDNDDGNIVRSGMIYNDALVNWHIDEKGRKKSVELTLQGGIINESSNKSDSSRVSVILALPRPLQLGRIIPMLAQLGVDQIILTSAKKVPNDYFGSHLLREHHEMRKLLIEGLSQAGNDVKIPEIHIFRYLNTFLKYHLDSMFPIDKYARVIAHPYNYTKTMKEIQFPLDLDRRIVVAVGPEGGWIDDIEVPKFIDHQFQPVSLGNRILRTDVAIVSLLALAHDVCD